MADAPGTQVRFIQSVLGRELTRDAVWPTVPRVGERVQLIEDDDVVAVGDAIDGHVESVMWHVDGAAWVFLNPVRKGRRRG